MKNNPATQLKPKQRQRRLKRTIRKVSISKRQATPTIASQRHMESQEIVVSASAPLPPGYRFLPKGNYYMSLTCRRRTLRAHQTLYIVMNDEKKRIGIRVPTGIYEAARKLEYLTRGSRQQKRECQDRKVEERFKLAVLAKFPQIPPDELHLIKHHATQKKKGRVGRTQTLEMAQKARLATQAHVRHTKTDYDELLKRGTGRKTARKLTSEKVHSILKQWAKRQGKGAMKTSRKEEPAPALRLRE